MEICYDDVSVSNPVVINKDFKINNNINLTPISKSWNELSSFKLKNNQHFYFGNRLLSDLGYSSDSDKIINFGNINDDQQKIYSRKYNQNFILTQNHKPYDAVNKCKSAGIIPYTYNNNKLYFLLQKLDNPIRRKDSGWNDFGGKKITEKETTAETAAREFSEETSCLFYLKHINDTVSYELLKNNDQYDENSIELLKKIILESQKYYVDLITRYAIPLYISSKETYISYLIKVEYIPDVDLPLAEDIHMNYEEKYLRKCKWFSLEELNCLDEKEFHKRLQITRIQQRINNYYKKGLFT